jgi:hypothetical protein
VDDESFYNSLVRVFEQALKYVSALPETQRPPFAARLNEVRKQGQNVGWGVGDDFDTLFIEYGFNA